MCVCVCVCVCVCGGGGGGYFLTDAFDRSEIQIIIIMVGNKILSLYTSFRLFNYEEVWHKEANFL